jgi:hypothetical protein
MSKTFTAAALVVIAGGSWLYLDYLNKQETLAIIEMRKEMQLSHERVVANFKAMAVYQSQFESANVNDLTRCYSEAEKANFNYIARQRKSANNKADLITIDKVALNKAAALLESDKERCKRIYESKLQFKEAVK